MQWKSMKLIPEKKNIIAHNLSHWNRIMLRKVLSTLGSDKVS